MNQLIDANNQQFKINEEVNQRIQKVTDTVNRATTNSAIANRVILTEIEVLATIINIDTINTILEDIQETIIRTKVELPSNKILTLKEIITIRDLLVSQGINITLPDEALAYVTPKIATRGEILLYILQVPKLEDENSTSIMILPLIVNNTIIRNHPQHLIKGNRKLFTSSSPNNFVQKASEIQEFDDDCIKPLVMGTKGRCNVSIETETKIQFISEDKLLISNARNEIISSDCGPNDRALSGNFLITFWNCTVNFNNKRFQSYEIRSEIQEIQGALYNIETTRHLITALDIEVINQENIQNRNQIQHVYLKQADHQIWIWSLSGGISVSTISLIILIAYLVTQKYEILRRIGKSKANIHKSQKPEQLTPYADLLSKAGTKPQDRDALSIPPGGVILQ